MSMFEKPERFGTKKVHAVVLSLALVLCFCGASFAEPDQFQNCEVKVFETDPGAIKTKLQQATSLDSGGVNFNFTNYATSAAGYESKRAINILSEGEDIYLVSEAYCGNTGVVNVYFFLTLPAGGSVIITYPVQFNLTSTGSNRFAAKLNGGLPAGMYRLQVVTLMGGNWIVSPDGYTFWVL